VRNAGAALLAGIAALSAPAAVLAQSGPSAEAMDELRCAIWAAQVSGSTDDPEVEKAFGFVMTYFIGRFEGSSGLDFEQSARVELVVKVAQELEAVSLVCGPKMESFGDRLVTWGSEMQTAAAAMEDESGL
jgi:hypothetical protein